MVDYIYKLSVLRKRKEDKNWVFWKEISLQAYTDYSALIFASMSVADSDNPRINQSDYPTMSATVVYRSKNISYRFEIINKIPIAT